MISDSSKSFEDTAAFRALLVSAFFLGFSMPVGRAALVVAAIFLLVGVIRRKCVFHMPLSAWLWLAIIGLACIVTATGINPEDGMGKLDKLAWYIGIPVAASIVTTRQKLRTVLFATLYGITILGLIVVFRNLFSVLAILTRFHGSPQAKNFTFAMELANAGSLIDGERLMIGIVIAVALIAYAPKTQFWSNLAVVATAPSTKTRRKALLITAGVTFVATLFLQNIFAAKIVEARFDGTNLETKFLFAKELIFQLSRPFALWKILCAVFFSAISAVIAAFAGRRLRIVSCNDPRNKRSFHLLRIMLITMTIAEILVLKRGSWFCVLAISGLLLVRRITARQIVVGLLALCALAFLVTPIRTRIAAIPHEFDVSRGGRATMWLKVAPQLHKERPWGIGFRSLTSEKMREIAPNCEKNRDHLHSNFVEMLVSLGLIGLALYLAWNAAMAYDAAKGGGETAPVFWAILAIFLNGFVEYNFADAEIVIALGLLGGLASAGKRMKRDEIRDNKTLETA